MSAFGRGGARQANEFARALERATQNVKRMAEGQEKAREATEKRAREEKRTGRLAGLRRAFSSAIGAAAGSLISNAANRGLSEVSRAATSEFGARSLSGVVTRAGSQLLDPLARSSETRAGHEAAIERAARLAGASAAAGAPLSDQQARDLIAVFRREEEARARAESQVREVGARQAEAEIGGALSNSLESSVFGSLVVKITQLEVSESERRNRKAGVGR